MNTNKSLELLKFHAPWCSPCKAMNPILESVITNFENIQLRGINVDEDPDSAVEYEVRSVPMLILLKNGEKVGSLAGLHSAVEIRDFLTSNS